MIDLSDEQIADFIETNGAEEFDCDGEHSHEILMALRTGKAVIERRSYGFAMVRLSCPSKLCPFLWFLYVKPEYRGRRLGRKFVRELLTKYGADYHMGLKCHGAKRRKFFGDCGFRVHEFDRVSGMRSMSTEPLR